jgi:hypothetical protein
MPKMKYPQKILEENITDAEKVYDSRIEHYTIPSGRTVVCIHRQKEGDEKMFEQGDYIGQKCLHGFTVAGYLVKWDLLSFIHGKRVSLVPKEEREIVESSLVNIASKAGMKPDFIDFW